MTFLKLTETFSEGDDQPTFINFDLVAQITPREKTHHIDGGSSIYFCTSPSVDVHLGWVDVLESSNEIFEKLAIMNNDMATTIQ